VPEDKETALAEGIIIHDYINKLATQFIAAVSQRRFWDRKKGFGINIFQKISDKIKWNI